MEDLEGERQRNIQRNRENLDRLGINLWQPQAKVPRSLPAIRPPSKKRKLSPSQPLRSSTRIASSAARPVYKDDEADLPKRQAGKPRATASKQSRAEAMAHVGRPDVLDKDLSAVQEGWSAWQPSGSMPTRDEFSTFHFEDSPNFTPNKSPEEMLREGCFGGSYFRPLYSRRLGLTISDDYQELPLSWTEGLDINKYLTSDTYDPEINKYKVKCGQSIEEWEAAGWINHHHDIRGWFQWYCRFFVGRRCDDDERQISRWRKCVGETGRWRRMLLKKYKSMGVREVFDDGEDDEKEDVSPVMHQTCHHWAYEVRQDDLDRFWKSAS